jgi:hypothetical protein
MDKLLDAHDQPKLNQEDIKHLNRSIARNEIEAIIKSLQTKKNPRTGVTAEFYQNLKKN